MTSSGMYGYAGKILRVDLSKRQISEEALDQAFLQKYLGGVGLGAYYLYREVPPAVKWSDPENRLILAIGPLNGLQMPGSGCFSVTTKGSLTEGAASSQANGFFGAYLKFCGYDGIVIKGKADGPVSGAPACWSCNQRAPCQLPITLPESPGITSSLFHPPYYPVLLG